MESKKHHCYGQEKHLTNDNNPRPRKGAEEAIVGINRCDNQQCCKFRVEVDGLISSPVTSVASAGVLEVSPRHRVICTPEYRNLSGF